MAISSERSATDGRRDSGAPGDSWNPWVRAMEDLCAWEAVAESAESSDLGLVSTPDRVGCLNATFEDGMVDELPLGELFRLNGFSDLEQTALEHCSKRVLDIGSAGGAAALELQRRGLEVTALDRHSGAAEVLRRRGLRDARVGSVFESGWVGPSERWDTLLFLMNGLGLCEELAGLERLLDRCAALLNSGGCVIADGCDLRLSPAEDEAGRIEARRRRGRWFGEAEITLRYVPVWPAARAPGRSVEGAPFRWLYVDAETLAQVASRCGWHCSVVMEDGADYLARLVPA